MPNYSGFSNGPTDAFRVFNRFENRQIGGDAFMLPSLFPNILRGTLRRMNPLRPRTLRCIALSLHAIGLAALSLSTGCTGWIRPTETRLELVSYDDTGRQEHYAEFSETYYAKNASGLLELLFIEQSPSTVDPAQTIEQIVYIKEFWNPRPGRTYAQATQTNAHVIYAMLSLPTGLRYDGASFLTYKMEGDEVAGWIESGNLKPRYRMGGAVEPFGPATFKGTFRAEENAGRIAEIRHQLETQFKGRAE